MMTEPTTDILDKADEILHAGQYTEAHMMLASFDASTLSGVARAKYCVLFTEVGLYVGTPKHDLIDPALELLKESSDDELHARAKFVKGWLQCSLGRYIEARKVLLEAYGDSLRTGHVNAAGRVLNRLAYIDYMLGDIDSGIIHLEECLAMYLRHGEKRHYDTTCSNLASLYMHAGRLTDSLVEYRRFETSAVDCHVKIRLVYREMMALTLAFKGDVVGAKKSLAYCEQYLDEYPREKAICRGNLGLINILDGKYSAAEKALIEGLELSVTIAPESSLVSFAKRLFGDLYVATDKYDLAQQFATEALVVAEKINERVEIAACWRIFAQVAQDRGDAVKSQEWYQKAIDLFGLIGSRYEMAVTRYLAAISGVYGEGERIALLYMARDYFQSEEVTPYLTKIDPLLPEAAKTDRIVLKPSRSSNGCPQIIAESQLMKDLLDLAEHVAQSEMTVFLTGDTGTGKDLLARFIHFCSGRKGEFVTVNAAAIPNPMIEAELFGHTKGAFTSADSERKGLLEQAHNGTFYLNEIADATPEFQAKLLEVLETREVRKLGSNKSTKVNFRLIAATNHDLKARMRDGHFRVDLYHRLNEIPLTLPPLSARIDDIGPLVQHFLKDAGFKQNCDSAARFAGVLALGSYPGNVRELQARVKHMLMVGKSDIDRMITLAEQFESESDRTLKALESCDWNRREAARMLGVGESTVRRRIEKYDLAQPVTD